MINGLVKPGSHFALLGEDNRFQGFIKEKISRHTTFNPGAIFCFAYDMSTTFFFLRSQGVINWKSQVLLN